MKQMRVLAVMLCVVLFFAEFGNAKNNDLTTFESEKSKAPAMFTEKENNISAGDDVFWEKQPNNNDNNVVADDEKRLYGPPPGGDGPAQKIVVPLGSGEIPVFLLLSILAIGYYCFSGVGKK